MKYRQRRLDHLRGGVLARLVGLAGLKVVERLLFHVGQQVVHPAARLLPTIAEVRVADPAAIPAVAWKRPVADSWLSAARPNCLRLFWHCNCRAASRAACTAGSNRAIKMPMIVITTNNSTDVKPVRLDSLLIVSPTLNW